MPSNPAPSLVLPTFTARSALPVLTLADLWQLPEPEWLIEGVLPKDGISVIYGPPESGKSFICIDMSLSVATGTKWCGRAVTAGTVVYLAAEGERGLKARCEGWLTAHEMADAPRFRVIPQAIQLTDRLELELLVGTLSAMSPKPELLVIDTLSRCFVGEDENSSMSMSRLVDAVEGIRRSVGCAVVLVHHSRKENGATERGSNALRGAALMMAAVQRRARTATISMKCARMKEASDFAKLTFELAPHGPSLVPVPTDIGTNEPPTVSASAPQPTSASQSATKRVLPKDGATHSEWKSLALAAAVKPRTFENHRTKLVELGLVHRVDGRYLPASG